MKCEICKQELNTYQGLSKHITTKHKITAKAYYDKYIRPPNVGICICGKPTPFLKLSIGYQKHCCARCAQLDPETKNNFRVSNPQKDKEIQKRTKETCESIYGGRGYGSNIIQEKAIQTRKDRYGDSYKVTTAKIREYAKQHDLISIEKVFKYNSNCGWINDIEIIFISGQRLIKKSDIEYIKKYKSKTIDNSILRKTIEQNYTGLIEDDLYLPELNTKFEFFDKYDIALEANKSKNYIISIANDYKKKNIRYIPIYSFNLNEQLKFVIEFLQGKDYFPNNLIDDLSPQLIYIDGMLTIYGY